MRTGSLRIGEVATRSGVSTRAIRVSEAAGVLPTPALESNGYRLYTRDAVEILGIIKQAQGLGLTLAEINAVGAIKRSGQVPCERVGALAREKLAELDRAMRTLAGEPTVARLSELASRPRLSRCPVRPR